MQCYAVLFMFLLESDKNRGTRREGMPKQCHAWEKCFEWMKNKKKRWRTNAQRRCFCLPVLLSCRCVQWCVWAKQAKALKREGEGGVCKKLVCIEGKFYAPERHE